MLEGGTAMSDRTRKYLPILKQIQKIGEKAKKTVYQKVRQGVHRLCQRVRQKRFKRQRSAETHAVATIAS